MFHFTQKSSIWIIPIMYTIRKGKQKALFLVLERGREAKSMMRYQGLAKCLRQTTNN